MRWLSTPALIAACTTVPRTATGQRPGTFELGFSGAWHTKTNVHSLGPGAGGLVRTGVWLPAGFSLEGEVSATRPLNETTKQRITFVSTAIGALLNLPVSEGSTLYFRLSYGKLSSGSACRFSATFGCNTFAAATVGVGIRVPVNQSMLFRGETMIRTRPTYDYTSFGANFGLAWMSGAARGAALADNDGDGVPNKRDRCPDTPRGALVDRRGCPTDFDGDGVFDGIDRCPATPKGDPVDQYGCPIKRPD